MYVFVLVWAVACVYVCEDVCGMCACGMHMVHLCVLVCVVHGKSVWCMCDVCVQCGVCCVCVCELCMVYVYM